jgi:seryl-tRNA synthetase
MLDIRWVRQNREEARARLAVRGATSLDAAIDRVLDLDEERRQLIGEGESLKARRNSVSQEVADRKRKGSSADDLIAEMRSVGDRVKEVDARLREVESGIEDGLLRIPNAPDPSVPEGGEESNVVVRQWEQPRDFDFEPRPHWEIGEKLGLMSLETGAKVAGSGFPAFTGPGAIVRRALINWMLDLHIREHGYVEASPPFLVHRDSMRGTGQYPKFVEDGDAYEVAEDGLFLIPTAEVPVTNFHRGDLLDGDRLPISYVAYSPCFRREAGAAGKDTRGLLRVHQFDKVELVRFEMPESSDDALETMTGHAERILQLLGLTYRVVLLAGGDLGFSARKTYDLEVWAPGVGRWLEVSSSSNFGDYQARRADIRFRRKPGEKPEFVHTLNASGLAIPRTLVAIIENGQAADGSVSLPQVLQPYAGLDRIFPER